MNQYVTGNVIRRLREKKQLTQAALGEALSVSDKTVSKWENGRGYPDITLLEPLAATLGISLLELLNGNDITNTNRAGNMLRVQLYVCPICGNVIHAVGEAVISCCGVTLPALEAECPDAEHDAEIHRVEDDWYITIHHPMTKQHYISFFAVKNEEQFSLYRKYAEGPATLRIPVRDVKTLYYYCNHHGLYAVDLRSRLREEKRRNRSVQAE